MRVPRRMTKTQLICKVKYSVQDLFILNVNRILNMEQNATVLDQYSEITLL